jgi:predicted Zn finger-like uncharacterized protein
MASWWGVSSASQARTHPEKCAFSAVPAQMRGEYSDDRLVIGYTCSSRVHPLCQRRCHPVVHSGQSNSLQTVPQKRVRGNLSAFTGVSLLDAADRDECWPAIDSTHPRSALERSTRRCGTALSMNGDLNSSNAADSSHGVVGPTMSAAMADTGGTSSFLQCVGCGAVYAVESEELEGEPRVVRCCTCLHEWYACEADLLWGDQEAAAAIESPTRERPGVATISTREGAPAPLECEETVDADDIDEFLEDDGPNMNYQAESPLESPEVSASPFLESKNLTTASETPNNEWRTVPHPGAEKPNVDDVLGKSRTVSPRADLFVEAKELDVNLSSSKSSSYEPSRRPTSELSSCNIFVGNLSFRATEDDLFRAFSGYGIVIKCQIPLDELGGSRGYGFVEMSGEADAERAMDALQGASILGRDICLSKARRRGDGSENKVERRYESTTDEKYEFRSRSVKWEGGAGPERIKNSRKSGWSARYSYTSSVREYAVWSSNEERKVTSTPPPRPNGDDASPGALTPKEEDKISSIFKTNASRSRNQRRNDSRAAPDTDGRRGSGDGGNGRKRGSMTDRRRGNVRY